MAVLLCVAPAAHAGRALFAADTPGSRIFGFGVGTDGAITGLPGFPILSGQGPSALVPGRDATHLYATFSGTNAVGVYSVATDGFLSSAGASVPTGLAPAAAAMSPDGTRLFVANAGSDSISRYAVDLDGSLMSIGAPTATGSEPSGVAMAPDGTHLYAANHADDTVSVFSVSASGAITVAGAAVAAGDGPTGLAVTPDGAHLYATNANAGTVSAWTLAGDGSLTSLGDPVAAGTGARAIAVSPDGTRVLVANPGASTISRFTVTSTGALTPVASAIAGPTAAMSIAISPDGLHAYVGGSSSLSAFDFTPSAGLALRSGSPVTTNGGHGAIAITPNQGPEAKFDVVEAPVGQASKFAGNGSSDQDGSVARWSWNFGDGSTGQGQSATHVYAHSGTYTVNLIVTDNDGCSTNPSYTGQSNSCAARLYASLSKTVTVLDPAPPSTPDPPCIHDGNDGFCGTPDWKAPTVNVLGLNDGASITTVDAPDEIVGTIANDPSGITSVMLRFTKAAGTVVAKKTVRKRVCHKAKGHKKRCERKKVVMKVATKTPLCMAPSGTKNYLVKYLCSKVKWIPIAGDTQFRWSIPIALGVGAYTVDVVATDGAGNADTIEAGRNHVSFNVIRTPSNSDTGTGTITTTPTTTTTTPVDDTGSPFGHG